MGGYARAGEEIPREANAKKGTAAAPLKQRGGSNGLAKGKIPEAAVREHYPDRSQENAKSQEGEGTRKRHRPFVRGIP
jgi:hypothetical protein